VIWGSSSLAQSLLHEALIDGYRLVVCPLALGSGRALFSEKVASMELNLLGAKMMDCGAVSLQYVPRRRRATT